MKRLRHALLVCLILITLSGAGLSVRSCLAETAGPATAGSSNYYTLPYSGENFQAYSLLWHAVGRCCLKGRTAAAVLDAYRELETAMPDRRFVYGETGWNNGGRFWPHRTHREGLSVDFMTPMLRRNTDGAPTPAALSCLPWNLWGYGTRLDSSGRTGDLEMDAEALIAHLDALNRAGAKHELAVKQVILDPPLLRILRASPNFRRIAGLPFMPKAAWFPHDGHYHVDFTPR